MKTLSLSRKARKTIVAFTILAGLVATGYAVNIMVTVNGPPTTSRGPATISITSAELIFPNETGPPTSCTANSGTSFTCNTPVFLTACNQPCGSTGTENNNYTISVAFTANPSSLNLKYSCSLPPTSAPLTCNSTLAPPFSTGTGQTASWIIVANSASTSTSPTVSISGS